MTPTQVQRASDQDGRETKKGEGVTIQDHGHVLALLHLDSKYHCDDG